MNIKQLLTNIAIKLLIDRIMGELATWLEVMAVLNLMKAGTLWWKFSHFVKHWLPMSCKQGNYRLFDIKLVKAAIAITVWSKQFGLPWFFSLV